MDSSPHTHHLPLTHHRRLLTQTLTTLSLFNNQIGEKGAQSIADALRTNTVSLFLLLTHPPSHPHSPSTPSHTDTHHTRSRRQSNRRERSPIHRRCLAHKHGQSLPPPHTPTISPSTHHRRLLTQTLTTLDLEGNQIGEKGAQSIADALRTNTVSLSLLLTHSPSHPHSPSTPSHTDTHHTQSLEQSNRRQRSPIHRRCLAHKHGQSLPPPPSHTHHLTLTHHRRLLTQTLTTLELGGNQIGDESRERIEQLILRNLNRCK